MPDWLSAHPGATKPLLTACAGDGVVIGSRPALVPPSSFGSSSTPSFAPVTVGTKFGYAGVPLVAQDKANTCWYAAACMVSYFYRAGPRLGVPSIWAHGNTKGITPTEFVQLAKNEGLTAQGIKTYHAGTEIIYPAPVLIDLLKEAKGPLWCAGFWFGCGHIIVLVGVDGDQVWFNDPDGGVRKQNTLEWFNQKIARQISGHILRKDLSRS
jgi:hypothetical protein